MPAQVFRVNTLTAPAPDVAVTIAVDTAYVAAQAVNGEISSGVFMMDNAVRRGSTGEGTLQLNTCCNAGSLIGFRTAAIDGDGSTGDQVIITAFLDVEGNVFTGAGHPIQQLAIGNDPPGSFWIGQALRAGTERYTIEIKITVGVLQPVSYYVWWDATLVSS